MEIELELGPFLCWEFGERYLASLCPPHCRNNPFLFSHCQQSIWMEDSTPIPEQCVLLCGDPVWVPSWGFLAQAVCPTLSSKVYTVNIWGEKKSQTSNPGLVRWRLSQGCVVDRKDSSLPEFTKVDYFCWVRFSNFILETEDRREAGWVCIWDSREERLVFLFSWQVASQE